MAIPQAEPLVELVGRSGETIGVARKGSVHRPPGTLHRAVSVLLLDAAGRLVLQRRASEKHHSAGRWSNTACGHPLPGESPRAAARRYLETELGLILPLHRLIDAGTVQYHVADPVSGLEEAEYDHLFVGSTSVPLHMNPREVAALAAVDLDDAQPAILAGDGFSAWYPAVLAAALPTLRRLRDR